MALSKIAIFTGFFTIVRAFTAHGSEQLPPQIETVFRLSIPTEPPSLDPAQLNFSETGYFYHNIMRGLFAYTNKNNLVGEGAEVCLFETPLKLNCRMRKVFWSDGRPVEAQDYVRAFRRLLAVDGKSTVVSLLSSLKNATAIHAGRLPSESLGVHADGKDRLRFEFDAADPDFLYKLTSSALVPVRERGFPARGELEGAVFNGPYTVVSWGKGRRLRLEANPRYHRGNRQRPPVEVLFIDDEQTALNLYEQKQLSFLRRLPSTYVAKYRSRPDFMQIPMARFDYLGFGEELKDQLDLRAALSHSADFSELQKLLDALGVPGCPSLPEELSDRPHCVKFDLSRAKKHWEKVPLELRSRRLKLMFTTFAGEDAKKAMEWFQAQWKKNLGFQVEIEGVELQRYLELLRKSPPAIFRKGVALERPTCLAALENFSFRGVENFLKLSDKTLENISNRMSAELKSGRDGTPTKPNRQARKTCGEGVKRLLDQYRLVPLGRMHFTLLVDPLFQNWSLNEMNQLDLSNLKAVAVPRRSKVK
jgi:oligopeptide transport system substrate-binding protein